MAERMEEATWLVLILFGGGDGGGIGIRGDGKVIRIPPYNPETMRQLRSLAGLAIAQTNIKDQGLAREIGALGQKVATTSIPGVLATVLPAGATVTGVAFLDDDGGFTCGSTGQHFGPFPGPHGSVAH